MWATPPHPQRVFMQQRPGSSRVSDVVILLVFGGVVLAFAAGPRPRVTLRAWLYYGYTAALIVAYAEARRTGSGGVFNLRGPGGDFDLAVALLLPLAVFAVARLTRARVPYVATLGAVVLGAVVAMALLRPPLPGDGDVLNLLSDIGRDIRSERQYLADDVSELQRIVFRPMFATFQSIATQFGTVAGLFLIGIWGQALFVSSRAAVRERSAAPALCCAALIATCVIGVLGFAPARWGASSYSVAVLAVLFGLAESLRCTSYARLIDSPESSGEDKMFS